MRPVPDPIATTATPANRQSNPARAPRASGRISGFGEDGLLVIGATVIVLIMAITCGAVWAGDRAADPLPAVHAAVQTAMLGDISGRWTGKPHALRADPGRCGPEGCTLTLDIVACVGGWCGREIANGSTCGGETLSLQQRKGESGTPGPYYDGKLSLASGSDPYVVEAHHRPAQGGQTAILTFVGDTGPELMLFRRSFPFNATLTRVADAICKAEKPVS